MPAEFDALSADIENSLADVFDELDVCVVHNALTLHFNLPLTAALHRLVAARRAPGLVAWCHDLSWTNPLYAGVVYDRYPWDLLRKGLSGVTYVVVSEDRRSDLSRIAGLAGAQAVVIPAGVDLGWTLGRSTRALLAAHKLLEADPFILLPVRITRRKNIEYAIEVTAALRQLGSTPRLLVTGPRGPHDPASNAYVRELQARVAEYDLTAGVVLLQVGSPGWKPTDQMMSDLFRAADLMLLPSAQEGFGIPLLEAAAVGLPIFCSDIAPFREIAGCDAEYFELRQSPAETAARIGRFVRQDKRYRLRKRVASAFDWERIFDQELVPLLRKSVRQNRTVLNRAALPPREREL